MKNVTKIVIAFCMLASGTSKAQEIFATSGDYFKNSAGSLSSTIGEPIGETFIKTNNILTQGFQQSKLWGVGIYEFPKSNLKISAFPNPTKEIVTLKVENSKDELFRYGLYDNNGKLIEQKDFKGSETEISFKSLTPSVYFINVFINQKEGTSFKIVKQ